MELNEVLKILLKSQFFMVFMSLIFSLQKKVNLVRVLDCVIWGEQKGLLKQSIHHLRIKIAPERPWSWVCERQAVFHIIIICKGVMWAETRGAYWPREQPISVSGVTSERSCRVRVSELGERFRLLRKEVECCSTKNTQPVILFCTCLCLRPPSREKYRLRNVHRRSQPVLRIKF